MNKNYYGIIMAGGVGSRFWPLSRKKYPKQFLDVFGTGKTLFQMAWGRLLTVCPQENIYIVANESYRDIIKQQIPGLPDEQILGEPQARNTAPCIAYASFKIHSKDPNAVIAILPSDHLILNDEEFKMTLRKGFEFCHKHDYLLTLGIEPSRPDTGYGYIQIDESKKMEGICKVKTFTEKPNHDLATHMFESGEFLWNSGMFIWNNKSIIKAFKQFLPEVHDVFHKGNKSYFTDKEYEYIEKAYELCPSISIDYGILEKSDDVYVLPASFNWSDIGTWNALFAYSNKDPHNNVLNGDMVYIRNSENCIVNVPDKKLVVLNSVKGLIVVETDGILLIADKEKEQEIRLVVNDIKMKYGDKFI
jgi:mannose-1-phosphate guanylyltransferase